MCCDPFLVSVIQDKQCVRVVIKNNGIYNNIIEFIEQVNYLVDLFVTQITSKTECETVL